MIKRLLALPGPRRYFASAYFAFAALFCYALYTLDAYGFSIQITYDASSKSFDPSAQQDTRLNPARLKIKEKVAVIIESRPLASLTPLLLHFSSVLGPTWPIILYTSQSTMPDAAPFRALIDSHILDVRFLPASVVFKSRDDVSAFLTTPWLYEQLAPAEHMLLFQSDSILCSKSSLKVDDFLQYSFTGAPIAPQYGQGFNGGLSLRNRTMMLDIVRTSNWKQEWGNGTDGGVRFEDQWFHKKLLNYTGARLPTVDEASKFAVETIWAERPLGYHQVTRWFGQRISEVDDWCPEHRLVVGDQIPA